MAWLLLGATILLEVAGTTMMKLSQGFTQLWPSLGVLVFYATAIVGVTVALKELELSVAYAIWSGSGTALTAMIGIALFQESVSPPKVLSLALVIMGIVGLNLAGGAPSR